MQKRCWLMTAAVVLAFMAACAGDDQKAVNPVQPTGLAPGTAGDAADEVTLKATAPPLVDPINGVTVPTGRPRLTWNAATLRYGTGALSYRVQLVDDAGALVEEVAGGGLSHQVTQNLKTDKTYRWRVRAEYQGAFGPWASYATFKTPAIPPSYIRGNEVFDGLIDGTTVGEIHGPVQFIAGQGVKLLAHDSHISYYLETTLQEGEFSLMVTGMDEGSPGSKTKVMSMQENGGDITTNDYRFTIEKRGRSYSPPGAVTYRVITGDSGDHGRIHDGTRIGVAFSDELWYFWRATWTSTGARVDVVENGVNGSTIYSRGVGFSHPYRPTPHVVHLGAPMGRAGAEDATVPGMIIKNVWVSPNPRPSWVDQER